MQLINESGNIIDSLKLKNADYIDKVYYFINGKRVKEVKNLKPKDKLKILILFKDDLKNDRLTGEDYEKMLRASMIAGMAITHTGTSLPHGLSYPVTYELGVPHGKAVGMFLGGYLENYKDKEDSEKVLSLLGFASAREFRSYLTDLLGKVDVSDELLSQDADSILANPGKLKNYPFEISKEELLHMAN